jgi:integrase
MPKKKSLSGARAALRKLRRAARRKLTLRQRADKWGNIGSPKAASSRRTIPLPPMVVNALRDWKLIACPRRDTGKKDANGEPITELHYVFPNGKGRVESQQNIVKRQWHPLQVAAGVTVLALDDLGEPVPVLDDDGKPVKGEDGKLVLQVEAKYSGFHSLRHFYASWAQRVPRTGAWGCRSRRCSTGWVTAPLP